MKKTYHVSIAGGPWDGAEVEVPDFPLRFVLTLPARPDGDRWDENQRVVTPGRNVSSYLLTGSHCLPADSARVELKYDFLSFELPCLPTIDNRSVRRDWRLVLTHFLSACRRRFVGWLLAPVDYPLDVRRFGPADGASASGRPPRELVPSEPESGSRSPRPGRIRMKPT